MSAQFFYKPSKKSAPSTAAAHWVDSLVFSLDRHWFWTGQMHFNKRSNIEGPPKLLALGETAIAGAQWNIRTILAGLSNPESIAGRVPSPTTDRRR